MDNPVRGTNFEPYSFCIQRSSLPVIPHSSVPSYQFHGHIDPSLPNPVRTRYVLTWCASRSAPRPTDSKNRLPPLSPANSALVASLQEQIVRKLGGTTVNISLYSEKSKERPPAMRTRRMSESEQSRRLCWRTRNSTYLLTQYSREVLILWFRYSHEDAAGSKTTTHRSHKSCPDCKSVILPIQRKREGVARP